MSETNWMKPGIEDMEVAVFVPMADTDRQVLACDLAENYAESDYLTGDPADDERLEATHFFIKITVPEDEGYTDMERKDYTWWDFGAMPAKQDEDGTWLVWCDDVYSTGNIWYQSTYTEVQVRAVYELAIQLAKEGRLYDDLYESCKSIMTFW